MYDVNGNLHKYFPDFLIKDDKNTIIEVKGDQFFDEYVRFINPYDTTPAGFKNAELKYQCMVKNNVCIYTSKELKVLGIKI